MAAHAATTEPREFEDSAVGRFVAVCSCGWEGELRVIEELAAQEAADHELSHEGE